MQDTDIIALYFERDEQAIEKTDEKYGAYLKKIAFNILCDVFSSEECCNDTYFKVWNSIPPTVPVCFRAFIARITRNLALDKYKAQGATKRGTVTESLDELSECVGEDTISRELDSKEIGAAISDFLKKEGESARIIFVRRYFYCESIKDIAFRLGMTEGAIKTSLSRTRQKLSIHLKARTVFI